MVRRHTYFPADTLHCLVLLCFFHIYPERLNHGWSQLSALSLSTTKQCVSIGEKYPTRPTIFCKYKIVILKWAVSCNLLCFPSQFFYYSLKRLSHTLSPTSQQAISSSSMIISCPGITEGNILELLYFLATMSTPVPRCSPSSHITREEASLILSK